MRVLKIASIFAGTVLGAGFASGQELWFFFARFKMSGVRASLFSGILIALFGSFICFQAKEGKKYNYHTYLKSLFGEHLANVIYFITQVFMFISFSIMVSGSSELLYTQFGLPGFLGGGITLLICFFCLANRVSGIARLNVILSPVMCIGIFVVSVLYSLEAESVMNISGSVKENYIISACLYMSFNILSSAAVLCAASEIAKNKKEAAFSAFLGGLVLTSVMFTSSLALSRAGNVFINAEFPMLYAAQKLHSALGFLYPPLIYMAMITTAVSSGFCVCEVLNKHNLSEKISALLVCIFAIPVSMVRFSELIKNCYVLFGFLGLLLICGVIIENLKNKVNSRKTKK